MSDQIDLATVTTNLEFGRALTTVRLHAGLSIRDVARQVRIPASTAGGYFSGAHLPGLQPADLLPDMLRACGVSDEAELARWTATWMRLRRARRVEDAHGVGLHGVSLHGVGLHDGVSGSVDPQREGGRVEPGASGAGHDRAQPGQAPLGHVHGSDDLTPAGGGSARADSDRGWGTSGLGRGGGAGRYGATAAFGGEGDGERGGVGELAPPITIVAPVARLNRIGTLRGRADILDLLSARLPAVTPDPADPVGAALHGNGTGAGGVHVLHGMGGIGKSTVALALAERALQRGLRTWWVSATGVGAVPAAMAALAVELGATRHELRSGSLPDLLWRYLRGLDEPWLLVIDNVDDPAAQLALPSGELLDGSGWLRRLDGTRGMVVVTTRDRSAWTAAAGVGLGTGLDGLGVRLYPVARLDDDDAGAALIDLAGPNAGTAAEARALGRRLGGLPLALAFAGRFLARTARMPAHFGDRDVPRTYPAYEQVLRAGGSGPVLPDFDGTAPAVDGGSGRASSRDRERALVGPTWELSLQVLADQGRPAARALLTLLACLGRDPIPLELLDPATLAAGPLFDGLRPTQLWDLLDALAGQGLIDLLQDPPQPAQIWLHPLVQDSFRRGALYGGQLADQLETVTALLARATRMDPRDPHHWAGWTRLRGHADASLLLLAESPDPAGLRLPPELLVSATREGRFLRATGHLTQAVAAYEAVLAVGRPLLGDEHADVLSAEHDLYRVTAALGRQAEAEPGFRRVLDARIRLLGVHHPDTLTTQHYLARTLRELGHVTEALELLELTLQRRLPVLGAEHRDTLTTQNNIGDVLAELGRLDEAEQTLHAVWSARGDILGPTHPATLVTLAHLTRLALRIGAADRAAAHATTLVSGCEQVLGPDHPRALAAMGLYGEVERRRGRLAPTTRATYVAAHERSLRVLGAQHTTTTTLARLATADTP